MLIKRLQNGEFTKQHRGLIWFNQPKLGFCFFSKKRILDFNNHSHNSLVISRSTEHLQACLKQKGQEAGGNIDISP
jgi:hypothetical protein